MTSRGSIRSIASPRFSPSRWSRLSRPSLINVFFLAMIPLSLRRLSLAIACWISAWSSPAVALDSSAWKTQQSIDVPKAGAVKLTLPPETLDAARPGLEDLRIIDAEGRETPYYTEKAATTTSSGTLRPRSFTSTLRSGTTEIVIETGTHQKLAHVALFTPAPGFLKAARVEVSNDREQWTTLADGVPLFRQFGAEQLQLPLNGSAPAWIRISIDDDRSRPIAVTGAQLHLMAERRAAQTEALPAARIVRRDEFTGATVFTLDLGAAHIPLASITVAARDAVFTRKITLLNREVNNETAVERTLAQGSIYRVAIDGTEPKSELTLETMADAPARELLVRIENGDSPPLVVDSITVRQRPAWLFFPAPSPGRYTLLTGHAKASAPRYDLAPFAAELHAGSTVTASVGKIEANPAYRGAEPVPATAMLGAALDTSEWQHARRVEVAIAGVQQLELDPAVLAGSANEAGDLRLVRDGKQIPYILERPALTRSLTPQPKTIGTPTPRTSRWEIALPANGMPVTRLMLKTATPVFERSVRIVEPRMNERSGRYDQSLAFVDWHRVSGDSDTLDIALNARLAADVLAIEMDNGDNPPIALTSAKVTYPVVRLLFATTPGPLTLVYGNPRAYAPRYDLALVADQLTGAEKQIATLGPAEAASSTSWLGLTGQRGGALFWGALALVVIALLVVVAKLLPKPPAG
jgi:hypothetical protein